MVRKNFVSQRGQRHLAQRKKFQGPDRVLAGKDYARYNVGIAKPGLATHPYNRVIREHPEMAVLQKEFDQLSETRGEEKIQMAVRVGRAKPGYRSWRKNVEDYLVVKEIK
ncbi:MAG: hypothetical protein WCK34_02945 [Bacteroidota bacterium]